MKLRYPLIALVAILSLKAMAGYDPVIVKKAKSGEVALECHLSSGVKIISPEMIVGYDVDLHYWTFKNGGSKSCQIIQ